MISNHESQTETYINFINSLYCKNSKPSVIICFTPRTLIGSIIKIGIKSSANVHPSTNQLKIIHLSTVFYAVFNYEFIYDTSSLVSGSPQSDSKT
jgi:hypothetical protein